MNEMLKRGFLVLLTGVITLVTVGDPQGPNQGGVPGWVNNLSGMPKEAPAVDWRDSSSAPISDSRGGKPADFAFPRAQRWEVAPGGSTPAGAPVRLEAKSAVSIEVLDRAAAQRAGASGFLFKTSKVDGPTRLTIDYSSFANAYGGNYADRVQLHALPACVLQGCTTPGKRVPTGNDVVTGKLTAEVAKLDGASIMAVTSGVSGEQGTYAATPLSMTGSWQVSPRSGAFNYSYPIDVPKPGGGTAPSVSLSYSSAAIDGLTLASNTQAGPAGLGWSDFANAYIERRYEQCYLIHLADLCWKSDNAVLSLGGMFGSLVPVNSPDNTQWKLESDPGWRIERNGNAKYTSIYGKQQWEVTGPDGTKYIFGGGHMPGRQTGSILGVLVLADDAGEPCRGPNNSLAGCEQGWRWYLDRVIDPDGNETAYLYEREENIYSPILGLGDNTKYHRGAVLKEIIYGGRDWNSATYSARILFDVQHRCVYLVDACPGVTPGNSGGFPDAPTDLVCDSLTKGTCSAHTPSFFSTRRYAAVRTEVKVGGVWKPVAKHKIIHGWAEEFDQYGVGRRLHVKQVQQIGDAFNMETGYPPTVFGFRFLDNRADHSGNIPKAARQLRINSVTNPFGGTTTVSYGRQNPCSTTYQPPVDPVLR